MQIYYPGLPGAYSHMAAENVSIILWQEETCELHGVTLFENVWSAIAGDVLGVIPVENSYAGSVHFNIYNFLEHKYRIIGEISIPINHCLLSKEDDISKVKTVYSHRQALAQCHDFLKNHGMQPQKYQDTAAAARLQSTDPMPNTAAIASQRCAQLYDLNILAENIQDQNGNTTRFLVIADPKNTIEYPNKKWKVAILFAVKNRPWVLYKCLGAFATNDIDLTKIESLPSKQDPFSYMFWVEAETELESPAMKLALEELEFFTKEIHILGEY